MLAPPVPTQESLFQAQFQYIAQSFIQSHAYYAKTALQDSTAAQTSFCVSSDLSMVRKIGNESHLTNPRFAIQGCLDSMYDFLFNFHRVLSSFLPDYQYISAHCPPAVLGKKTRSTPDITLVLDLDETLIHSSATPMADNDQIITINNGTSDVNVF